MDGTERGADHETQTETETHTCRVCDEDVVPVRHDDTGLSCPECGVGISYADVAEEVCTR